VEVKFNNFYAGISYYWFSLEGSNDNDGFSRKVLVNGAGPAGEAGGPLNYGHPPCAVVHSSKRG